MFLCDSQLSIKALSVQFVLIVFMAIGESERLAEVLSRKRAHNIRRQQQQQRLPIKPSSSFKAE